MSVWDQLFGTILWTMGPAVVWEHGCPGQLFGTIPFGTIVWDHVWDNRLGPWFLGPTVSGWAVWDPQFGTMRVWDHGSSGPAVWDHTVSHLWDDRCLFRWGLPFGDHGCLGPHNLGPCLFGTIIFGPLFGTMRVLPCTVWDHGCLERTTIRVWDLFGGHRLGPWGTVCVWFSGYRLGPSTCLGPPSFGTTVWDYGCLGPTLWDHASFGTMGVWDHCLDHACLGPTMGVWDHWDPPPYGSLGSVVWDHTVWDHLFGTGCLFRLEPPFGTMRVWDPQFETMGPSLGVWDS